MDGVADVTMIDARPSEATGPAPRLRVCLAASGGGHVRQLLDLEPAWSKHDYFFVTEETSLGESLKGEHPTFFVPHVAIGQSRLAGPLHMLKAAIRNLVQSIKIVRRERPDVVISTGAGAVFFTTLWARLTGAKIVIIESFARFDHPSLFGRLAAPLAHRMVIQSPALAPFYPRAKIFDPLRILETQRPPKKPLMFATVGATLPFERLVNAVTELKISGRTDCEVILQTGIGAAKPAVDGMEVHETLPFSKIQDLLRDAEIVVCHGGTGSLITALRQGCHVIAMPRLMELGEHYDNHQAEITEAFAARGLIAIANSTDEIAAAIDVLRAKVPVVATTDPAALVADLSHFLANEAQLRRSAR
jgi:UDP-N-acetylglucosamine transferase subunit ALG13